MTFQFYPLGLDFKTLLESTDNLLIEVDADSPQRLAALELLVKNGIYREQPILFICPDNLVATLRETLAAVLKPIKNHPPLLHVPDGVIPDDWDPTFVYVGIAGVTGTYEALFAAHYASYSVPDTFWMPSRGLLVTVGFDHCLDRREQAQFQIILSRLRTWSETSTLREVMVVDPLQNAQALAQWLNAAKVRLRDARTERILDSALTDPDECAEIFERVIAADKEWPYKSVFGLFDDATFGDSRDTSWLAVVHVLEDLEEVQHIFYTEHNSGRCWYTVRPPQERHVMRSASSLAHGYFAAVIWDSLPTLTPFDTLVAAACDPEFELPDNPVPEPGATVINKLGALPSELFQRPLTEVETLLMAPSERLWGAFHAALVVWSSVQNGDSATTAVCAGIDAADLARLKRQFRRELHTLVGTAREALRLNTLRAQAILHLVSGISPRYATLAMIPTLTTPMLERLVGGGYTTLASLLVDDASRDLHREGPAAFRAVIERRAELCLKIAALNPDVYDTAYAEGLVTNALLLLMLDSEQDYQAGFVDESGASLELLRWLTQH